MINGSPLALDLPAKIRGQQEPNDKMVIDLAMEKLELSYCFSMRESRRMVEFGRRASNRRLRS